MAAGSYNALEPRIEQQLGQMYPGGTAIGFNSGAKVDLYPTTSFLFMTAFMVLAVVTGAELAIAGGERIQASEAGIRNSKKRAWQAVRGFVGVLSIFVLLYTFNKGMLRGDVGLEELKSSVRKAAEMPVERAPATSQPTTGNRAVEKATWDSLTSAGIKVVSTTGQTTPCTEEQLKQSKPTCVSLIDMPQAVTTMLVELRSLCPGNMQITGGTEPGHKTHGPGKAAVDVDDNDPQINSCIRRFPKGPNVGSWCKETFSRSGFIFCDENGPTHWHVFR